MFVDRFDTILPYLVESDGSSVNQPAPKLYDMCNQSLTFNARFPDNDSACLSGDIGPTDIGPTQFVICTTGSYELATTFTTGPR